ncbi:MAG TPA: hypothetical protein VJM82_02060 [Nitrospiraceae bacterium]|nr:hypothetical protein [Nitrospiraceae bacterium]
MGTDRYFGATILFGHLHIGSVSDQTWDEGRLLFFQRTEVDPGVVDECGDRIVETHEELTQVLATASAITPTLRIWIHERLLDSTRQLMGLRTARSTA